MSDEYNVKLLVKEANLNAISINSANVNSHNKKYSGFKDLLKDNIPESLVDYNGNAYDISSVFHDTNWSSSDKTESEKSSQKFSQIETNANLELYKNAKLVPHEDASGTTHKLWTVYDDASNNLLEHMINYKFDNSGSYLPILTYYNGSAYVESTMFSDPLWWLIDYENHAISFFNTDSVLNGGTVNISASSANPPKLTFYRYIGKTKVNNKLIVEGDISCNGDLKTNNVIKDNNGITRISLGTTNTITGTLNITDNLNITGTIGSMFDNRIYEVDEISPGRWEVGFGCWDNNNSGPYADMIVLKTYGDHTGGNPNLIAFKKSGIGMRIYQDNYSSTSAFSTYRDVLLAENHASVSSLNCDGNVGIGTTTPGLGASSFPTKLDISGGGLRTTTSGTGLKIEGYHIGRSDNNSDWTNGAMYIQHYNSGNLLLCTGSSSGNVGIGTQSPDEKLEIIGNLKLRTPESTSSQVDAANIYLDCNNGSGTSKNGIIWKTDFNNGVNNYTKDSAGIYFQPEADYFRGGLTFYTNNTGNTSTAATEKMRIDQSGNVGIGRPIDTSTFTYRSVEMCKFNVHADHETENNHPSNIIPAIKITRKTPSNGGPYPYNHASFGTTANNTGYGTHETYSASIDFYPFDYYANPVHSARIYAGNDYRGSVWQDGKIYLSTRTGNTWSSVVVSHNGYVGIGTASPGYPLEVSGFTETTGITGNYFNNSSLSIQQNPSSVSISTKLSNGIWSGGVFISSSDQRIKENIRDVSDNHALQKVRDISCVYYEYKDKINRGIDTTIGFIAQQVKEHIPIAISLQKDIIPNEMRFLTDYSWNQLPDSSGNYDLSNNQYKLTIHDLNDNSGNTLYRFYVSNDPSGNDEIKKEIKSGK